MTHPDADDTRCEHCHTNLDDHRTRWHAPCPNQHEHDAPTCAACCASSDSECIDCVSLPMLPTPKAGMGFEHGTPPDRASGNHTTPLARQRTELTHTDAAAAGPTNLTRWVGSEPAAAATAPRSDRPA